MANQKNRIISNHTPLLFIERDMTDKEKAWAYDGALNRAKAAIDNAADKDLVKGIVTTIFPLLRESEDERMRKMLIDRVRSAEELTDELREWILAYLEKQKDASKAIEAVDRIYKYTEVENVANAHDMNDSNPNKKYYCGWNDALGKIAGILQDVYSNEKQKEQKPLSTEETELNSIAFLEQMGYTCIPPGKELKPVEWSENDKENLGKCCAIIACPDMFFDTYFRQKCLDFLFEISKKFSLQPKQEWSEEDEKTIDDAYCWLCEYAGSLIQKNYEKSSMLYGIAEKFKSLRPQYHGDVTMTEAYKMGLEAGKASSWKPSDEQMQCLLAVITNQYNAGAESCHLTLGSLYNDLKKLI